MPLTEAHGRVLAGNVVARRDQPPFNSSAMDGYAIGSAEARVNARFTVIGEAAAGHGYSGQVKAGQAVRIFTGAPMPAGADFVVIQEDVTRHDNMIRISRPPGSSSNLRRAGSDFARGTEITAPRRLCPHTIALLASMNVAAVPVTRKPVVALIATGDELVMPGHEPGPNRIVASNTFGLRAMAENTGARTRMLPIARDNTDALSTCFRLAEGADLVVTVGGASVGDHDLVGKVAKSLGLTRSFYRIAMRPGKPLMAGCMGSTTMLGLPGNPVSAMVCGHLFMVPMIRTMLGEHDVVPVPGNAILLDPIGANGPREHYMRAVVRDGHVSAFDNQDSAMLSVLAQSNALLVRPAHDRPRPEGATVPYLPI